MKRIISTKLENLNSVFGGGFDPLSNFSGLLNLKEQDPSRFNNILSEILKIHSGRPDFCKKIMEKLLTNFHKILIDQEIPDSIKDMSVRYIPEAYNVLHDMSIYKENILMDKNGRPLFPEYESIASKLRLNLQRARKVSGITFTGRSLKLFSWTRALIERTQNPLVGYAISKIKNPNFKQSAIDQFRKLNDISNILVLHIACGDDIADNIQDAQMTKIFSKIPFMTEAEVESTRSDVQVYEHGIYIELFDYTQRVWSDAMAQLTDLLGRNPVTDSENEFKAIHQEVMGSLTYSCHMNEQPHDLSITRDSISKQLDPNIMIKCVRYLERLLVQKLAATHNFDLPIENDLIFLDELISISQKNAAASNAAATAPRELKEGDLSSVYPFEINRLYNEKLTNCRETTQDSGKRSPFVDNFEQFLVKKEYKNHFFLTYFEEVPRIFDLLSLLILRRNAMKQVFNTLLEARSIFDVPESDFHPASLGITTVDILEKSKNENLSQQGKTLKKLILHISLIDDFCDYASELTNVQSLLFNDWDTQITKMRQISRQLDDLILKEQSEVYVNSMELFLVMYLMFKRSFDGTI